MISINNTQVWFITGCTSGTGLALSNLLLEKNQKVAGTSRNLEKLNQLEISKHPNFLALEVDLIDEKSVQAAIAKTIEHHGDLTHIVNNAGYGLFGSVEEITDSQLRNHFDALYFGPLNVIRASLPHLRSKNNGYIFNISSIAGIKATRSRSAYNAVKFAVTGATEAIAEDVAPFNIKVTNVVLGLFATSFASSIEKPPVYIPEYKSENHLSETQAFLKTIPNGNVDKFAEILFEYSTAEKLPVNLIIGPDMTFSIVENKIKQLTEEVATQRERNSKVVL